MPDSEPSTVDMGSSLPTEMRIGRAKADQLLRLEMVIPPLIRYDIMCIYMYMFSPFFQTLDRIGFMSEPSERSESVPRKERTSGVSSPVSVAISMVVDQSPL